MEGILATSNQKVKTPTIFRIYLNLVGLISLIVPILLEGFKTPNQDAMNRFGSLGLLITVAIIASAFGLARMKLWALYLLTFVTLILTIVFFFAVPERSVATLFGSLSPFVFLIYPWLIRKDLG
jgi:hypothetical protein